MGSKKQRAIMEAARQQFWKHGFKRVSVDELCAAAGVSKMTFYKYFQNKIELAKQVFLAETEVGLAKFKSIFQGQHDPAETIKMLVQLKLDGSSEISKEFLQDFYADNDEGLKDFVMGVSRDAWVHIVAQIREAQERNQFTKSIKPELLMYFSEAIGGLITNPELLKYYHTAPELIGELTHLMAYGLRGEEERM